MKCYEIPVGVNRWSWQWQMQFSLFAGSKWIWQFCRWRKATTWLAWPTNGGTTAVNVPTLISRWRVFCNSIDPFPMRNEHGGGSIDCQIVWIMNELANEVTHWSIGDDSERTVAKQRGRYLLHSHRRVGVGAGCRLLRIPLLVARRFQEAQG